MICTRTSVCEEFQLEIGIACGLLLFVLLALRLVLLRFPSNLDGKVILEVPALFRIEGLCFDPYCLLFLASEAIVMQ